MSSAPNPHAHMPSYGMRCRRRGVATDAPPTRMERAGLLIGRTLRTIFAGGKVVGGGMLLSVGCGKSPV